MCSYVNEPRMTLQTAKTLGVQLCLYLAAFGVQEMAVGRIQVVKQCQDRRVLVSAVWDSFANIAKICTPRK